MRSNKAVVVRVGQIDLRVLTWHQVFADVMSLEVLPDDQWRLQTLFMVEMQEVLLCQSPILIRVVLLIQHLDGIGFFGDLLLR